jgi:hypothetical protein
MINTKVSGLMLSDLVGLDYRAEQLIRNRHPFFGRLVRRMKLSNVDTAKADVNSFIRCFRLSSEETKVAWDIFKLFHN